MSNYCEICGKPLTVQESVERGIGPVCADHVCNPFDWKMAPLAKLGEGKLTEVGLVCKRRADGLALTNIPQVHVFHSPDGFEWGYGGSGPADLALNILALLIPISSRDGDPLFDGDVTLRDGTVVSRQAFYLHQRFKFDVIAKLPKEGGVVPIASIREWIQQHLTNTKERKAL